MKTPIEVSDILAGDLIRYEYPGNDSDGRADEYRASRDGDDWQAGRGTYFLLDRPDAFPEGSTWFIAEDCKSWFSSVKRGEEVTINRRDPDVEIPDDERAVRVKDDPKRTGIIVNTKYLTKDRPAPPVELPHRATLGWINGDWPRGPRLAVWRRDGDPWLRAVDSDGDTAPSHVPAIKSFTAATAVPTDALEKLRAEESRIYHSATDWINRSNDRRAAIETFLTAVDAAGSGDE